MVEVFRALLQFDINFTFISLLQRNTLNEHFYLSNTYLDGMKSSTDFTEVINDKMLLK